MDKALPPVDPEFMITVSDRDKLNEYARGLLQHLLDIRSGLKAQGYPIATIKAAAVWLIMSYAEARVAPSKEAALLIEGLVQPNRAKPKKAEPNEAEPAAVEPAVAEPNNAANTSPVRASSEEAYRAAIHFEAGRLPDPKGQNPSNATLYAVARHIRPWLRKPSSQKTAEGIVRDWRKIVHYRSNVALLRPAHLRGSRPAPPAATGPRSSRSAR